MLLAFGVLQILNCIDGQTTASLGDFIEFCRGCCTEMRMNEREREQDRTVSNLLSRCFRRCLILGSDLEQKSISEDI